jgi:hypothetical protein
LKGDHGLDLPAVFDFFGWSEERMATDLLEVLLNGIHGG